ncbi:MAG: hypothetical protein V2I97_20405 [Desulfococcaceae bacterium]|jgi:hypothetical protein|nr:hypothetical protein [Desulfococcaceae bacterium]
MQKERFILEADGNGHVPFLPVLNPYQKIEIIILPEDNKKTVRRKPSPFLAGKIRFADDDLIASPLTHQ